MDSRSTQKIVNDTVRRLTLRIQRDLVKMQNYTTLSKEVCLEILEAAAVTTINRIRKAKDIREGASPWLKITVEAIEDDDKG